jgi:hypothetical protein
VLAGCHLGRLGGDVALGVGAVWRPPTSAPDLMKKVPPSSAVRPPASSGLFGVLGLVVVAGVGWMGPEETLGRRWRPRR